MTQNERVKEVRKTLGLTLEKFGDRLGIKKAAVSKIEKGEKTIVIGRKGTGKSAIYTYICNEYKKESVKLVLNDYPWQLHDKFRNEVVSERECYVNSWMFLLYIEIAKKIVIDDESIWSSSEKREIKRLKKSKTSRK